MANAANMSHLSKAQLSLLLNFASRAPSIIGMLFFIPRVHAALDDALYGDLMAAMALGGLACVLFSGGNVLGRRRIGEAMFGGKRESEARAFLTLGRASMLATVIGGIGVICYALSDHRGWLYVAIAILPILNGFTGAMDEARAAYNEHYITAGMQMVLQLIAYAIGLSVPWVAANPLAAAAVMVGPSILASVFAGAWLLMRRPYLLHGSAPPAWHALSEGLPIGLIDGLVMMAVNLSVVLVQAELPPEGGAWYATIVRLFMIAMSPVLLTLVPLTSYLRGIWNDRTPAEHSRILKIWLLISLAYGSGTAVVLGIGDVIYVDGIMGVMSPFSTFQSLPIYAGLGAVVIFKGFSGLSYMVLGTRLLNQALGITIAVMLIGVIAAHHWGGIMAAVTTGGGILAIGIPMAMLIVAMRSRSTASPVPNP